jgi:hypothetical protein
VEQTRHRSTRVVVARVSPGLAVVGWVFMLGGTVFLAVTASKREWVSLDNLRQAALTIGVLLGLWLVVVTMGIVVRRPVLTMRGLWFAWSGSPWAIRGAQSDSSGLTLVGRHGTDRGLEDRVIAVTAFRGSVLEQVRGDVRTGGAVRRLRNAQVASPIIDPDRAALRRRFRAEAAALVPVMAGAEWLLVALLWSRG